MDHMLELGGAIDEFLEDNDYLFLPTGTSTPTYENFPDIDLDEMASSIGSSSGGDIDELDLNLDVADLTSLSTPGPMTNRHPRKQTIQARNVHDDSASTQQQPSKPRMYELNPNAPNISESEKRKIIHAQKSKNHRDSVKQDKEYYKQKSKVLQLENANLKMKIARLEERVAGMHIGNM